MKDTNKTEAKEGKTLARYRKMSAQLDEVRRAANSEGSLEEDRLLDSMDTVWWELSEEEKALFAPPSKQQPKTGEP